MKNIITVSVFNTAFAFAMVFGLAFAGVSVYAADLPGGGYSYDGGYSADTGGYSPDTYYLTDPYPTGGSGSSYTPPPSQQGSQQPAPTCSLKANKTSIEKGENFMLTWSTKNAKKVTLNGNEVHANNTRKVEGLTTDKAYTLVVKGGNGKTVTCKETVKVKEPAPECTLKVSPASISYNGSVNVTWTTKNADWVKLDGDAVSKDGSKTRTNLTKDQTYTLTVQGINKRVTCTDKVNVGSKPQIPPPPPPPVTDVCPNIPGVQPNLPQGHKFENGKCVPITTPPPPPVTDVCPNIPGVQPTLPPGYTLNAQGKCVPITTPPPPPVTDVCPNIQGNQPALPANYTYDSHGNCIVIPPPPPVVINNENNNVNNNSNVNNNVNNNNVTVNVPGYPNYPQPPVYQQPSCNLAVSQSYVYPGHPVVLSWYSYNAAYGYINQGIGSVSTSGSRTVYPYYTTTYTGTFYGQNGQQINCSVTVNTYTYPTYVPPTTPYVTLSAVPYTGLELGPVGTAIYWSFLVLWCLIAAYLIAVKKVHYAIARRTKSFLFGSNEPEVETASPVVDLNTLATMVRAIVEGPQPTQSKYRTAGGPAIHVDATDEFILSQIKRS